MSSSANEDQELRENNGMGDSNAMTIEFLRARLLSERSVSKAARQRADELAERVSELEEQLKFISLQRKKAEKATVDVLAILENHGLSDVSEGFDSCSDQDETVIARNGLVMNKETSTNLNNKKNETAADSSSEHESSPSTGRSLSWKSSKESEYSMERKKYADPVRRRASFASSGSSARRVGKSCRRIRRRETRLTDDLRNASPEKATSSRNDTEKNPPENPTLGPNSGNQNTMGNFSGHERDEDMESALQHQARLIGQYEEEEKAQREWEEKFRENNSATQDSCDQGVHSDVTEELCENKPTELLPATGTSSSNNQEPVDPHFSKESTIPDSTMPSSLPEKNSQGEKSNGKITCESDFSFPTSKENANQDFQRKPQNEISPERFQECPPTHNVMRSQSSAGLSYSHSSSSLELAIVPQETPNNLGSVLEALQKAKLSLNQTLNSERKDVDNFKIPFASPGIFGLPTDNQSDATTRGGYRGMGPRSSFDRFSSEITAGNRFNPELAFESRSAFSSLTAPKGPLNNAGITTAPPPLRSFSQPRMSLGLSSSFSEIARTKFVPEPALESRSAFSSDLFLAAPKEMFDAGIRPSAPAQGSSSNRMNQYTRGIIPSDDYSYASLPDRVSLNEGRSKTFSSLNTGMPPVTRLSSYDDLVMRRPDTYR